MTDEIEFPANDYEDFKRGWAACLAGKRLTLGLGAGCDSPSYAEGFLACASKLPDTHTEEEGS